jgi:cytoskeletal protein CcmA (bactofilin family)
MTDKNKKKAKEESLEGPSSLIEPNQTDKTKDSSENLPDNSTLTDSGPEQTEEQPASKKHAFSSRIISFANLYFIIFLVLILIGAGGIIFAVKFNDKNSTDQASKTDSLTDKQLTELKSNTTLVGDAQQTLDIQGNSIFEGQVLMRNNVDVAGSLKIGGSLSLPAITVGGSSTFGQIHVNDQLTVSGNTTLQGTLTVQKGLSVSGPVSFGLISAATINATNLQLNGDFIVNRHISVNGGTPGRSGGTALGAGGTASISGTDTAGTVTINTGGGPPAGCFATINFTQRFNVTPHVIISPSNSSSSTLNYYTNRSATSFSVCTTSAPAASSTYLFDYMIID